MALASEYVRKKAKSVIVTNNEWLYVFILNIDLVDLN